jgi:hypothetical protein
MPKENPIYPFPKLETIAAFEKKVQLTAGLWSHLDSNGWLAYVLAQR